MTAPPASNTIKPNHRALTRRRRRTTRKKNKFETDVCFEMAPTLLYFQVELHSFLHANPRVHAPHHQNTAANHADDDNEDHRDHIRCDVS